jgi:uncharacterized protein (TIGR00730 family)
MSPEKNIGKKPHEEKKPILNVPPQELPVKPLTVDELDSASEKRIAEIDEEFKRGFEFIKKYQKSVSFFGSARFDESNPHYTMAQEIARRIASELKYAIVTGGGPGIMEAANRGAYEANGDSYGITIKLPREQAVNPYVKEYVDFYYFFVRKVILSFSAEAYLFFPGGFGTMDEFFEILTLVQTHKIPHVPLILVGKDFWEPFNAFVQKNILENHNAIDSKDMKLYKITDDVDEIIQIIKEAPMRKE